ncbi:uncharacterized protein METZ01_LOCUS318625, partial [marine metagenome]
PNYIKSKLEKYSPKKVEIVENYMENNPTFMIYFYV